jgi:oxygen-independent coproporphyrinogen-3 oxidase
MKTEWVMEIMQVISKWQIDANEVTMEMNPSVSETHLRGFKEAGINRVSFGVQSLDDNLLSFLGRDHNAEQAINIIKFAKTLFDNISLDLMYYLPGQNTETLESTLDKALALDLQHISCYSLTIEDNTVFGRLYKKGSLILPSDDLFCKQYELIIDKFESAEFLQYELSNFAKSGYESQHNLIYWRYEPFLGIGPGAHSRLDGSAIENHKLPEKWLESIKRNQHGIFEQQKLPINIITQETLMMNLRLNRGMELNLLNDLIQKPHKITNLQCSGDIIIREGRVNLSTQGFMRYNSVINYLIY